MAQELPPYVSSTGLLQDLFKKIQEAPPPPRFSQDYLFTNLKFKKSGSTNAFIPFLKRLGFLSNDGAPTDLYKKFRNPDPKISGQAMSKAFKIGYNILYARNEYWYKKNKTDLKNFLIEILEVESDSGALKYLLTTIETLRKYTSFEESTEENTDKRTENEDEEVEEQNNSNDLKEINLSYTINLNLPETSDITVFNAIFKSLKENLLKK